MLFLTNLFEMMIDDVIAMTHEKVSSELRLYIQKILIQKREYRFTLIRDFYRHFKKSSDFEQNFIMPMVSLRAWMSFPEIDLAHAPGIRE